MKSFTTALKRMHPAVGKAGVMCLDSQMDQFAEAGGVPVLDVVKHVGAGIASVLPLGVMKLASLIHSLLLENDRTMGIICLVSAHAAFNVVPNIRASWSMGSSAFGPNTSWYCGTRRNRSCPSAT